MSKHHRREFIIAYDIADPRRLTRIHRMLKRLAMPLQYSVFYAQMSDHQRDKLARLLENEIQPKEDDIRIYPLPRHYNVQYLGEDPMLEGLYPDDLNGDWEAAVQTVLDKAERRQQRQERD